jgi:hypothetical protein
MEVFYDPRQIWIEKKRISIWELLMRDMASAVIDVLNEKGYELNFPLQIK